MKTALITGASGLLGSALSQQLTNNGWQVRKLGRNPKSADEWHWDPAKESMQEGALDKIHLVVHLAGEGLIGRWTMAKRQRILQSRLQSTRFLLEQLDECSSKDVVLISASGAHYYREGEDEHSENGPEGEGFLADVCRQWELAAQAPCKVLSRRIFLRTGVVLSDKGGALKQMLLPFRMGLGGPLGSGEQWFSWIALEDWCRLVVWLAENDSINGPVNAVSPFPLRQKDFAGALGEALRRPAILRAPPFAIRLLAGQMGEEMLLHGIRVQPQKALEGGFEFKYLQLDSALNAILKDQKLIAGN
jgi:uncharacterized protein (TIGR01777 family)